MQAIISLSLNECEIVISIFLFAGKITRAKMVSIVMLFFCLVIEENRGRIAWETLAKKKVKKLSVIIINSRGNNGKCVRKLTGVNASLCWHGTRRSENDCNEP